MASMSGDALPKSQDVKDVKILILSSGVSGITAAQILWEKGIKDFKIIEAHGELGRCLCSEQFGDRDKGMTTEVWRYSNVSPS